MSEEEIKERILNQEIITVDGTGQRFDTGKLDLNDCPVSMQVAVASVFSFNSKKTGGKYDDANWKKGQLYSKPLSSAKRHLEEYINGIDLDEESGLPHLWMLATNVAMLIEYTYIYPEGDNRLNKRLMKQASIKDLLEVYKTVLKNRENKGV